jgi:ParB family chromosome partitioning protein
MKTAYQILTLIFLSLSEINTSKYQIRKAVNIEKAQELIQSVEANGIAQPVLVTQEKGVYYLVAGFRRIHAASIANQDKVPCLVVKGEKSKLAGFIENQFHEKMHPIDRAEALKMHFEDFGGTQREFAEWLGVNEKRLSEWMSLCRLDESIKAAERKNPTIPARELYPLSRIKGCSRAALTL